MNAIERFVYRIIRRSAWKSTKGSSTNSNTLINVEDVYIATATIISSHDDDTGNGPKYVTWYFLVNIEDNVYCEFFSGKKLEKEENTHIHNVTCKKFDIPYIVKIEPVTEYLSTPYPKQIDIQSLFDIITNLNVLNFLGVFDNNENEKN